MSDRNGAWRRAASWGAVQNLGTLCLEVQKSARAAWSHTDAWSFIFIYVLSNFISMTRLSRRGSYAFFSWCRSWVLWKKEKMDTAAILLYAAVDLHGVRSSFVESRRKETAALISQNRRFLKKAWQNICVTTVFFFCRRAAVWFYY